MKTDNSKKLEKLMNALKIQVKDNNVLAKDFDSILEMFDQLQKVEFDENLNNKLLKKQIVINDLRQDLAKNQDFRLDLKGKYIKVPSVSKKDS